MHERTLQRQLRNCNLVFEDIVDQIRSERADELLRNSSLSMAQIAALLGYSEQAVFNRASLRWFDATPMEIRRAAQAQG
jgi:AraC-like DNA-binding protein